MIIQLSFSLCIQICISVVGIASYSRTHSQIYYYCLQVFEWALLFVPVVFPLSRLLDPDLRKKLLPLTKQKRLPNDLLNSGLADTNVMKVTSPKAKPKTPTM